MEKVGAKGFEPSTPTTPKWCATKLRYAPTKYDYFRLKHRRVYLACGVITDSILLEASSNVYPIDWNIL